MTAAPRLSISIPWDPRQAPALLARARAADAAGVDTIWINEGFGHDAFSGLTLLATQTSHARLGTGIVNSYSRTPGALAQQFATLDQLSNGRAVIGLGASGQGVIERFHGMPFQPAIKRLREVTELLRAYWRRERFTYHGSCFQIERALIMGVEPVQAQPPIMLATLHPKSVQLTAEVADGWLPAWIPFNRLAGEIARLRAWAAEAGRDPAALTVRAPSNVIVAESPALAERVRAQRRRQLAFFVARNGDFYYHQFQRQGLAAEAEAIRVAWDTGGEAAGIVAVSEELAARFDFVGSIAECRERIRRQSEAGVDLHQVTIAGGDDPDDWRTTLQLLLQPAG